MGSMTISISVRSHVMRQDLLRKKIHDILIINDGHISVSDVLRCCDRQPDYQLIKEAYCHRLAGKVTVVPSWVDTVVVLSNYGNSIDYRDIFIEADKMPRIYKMEGETNMGEHVYDPADMFFRQSCGYSGARYLHPVNNLPTIARVEFFSDGLPTVKVTFIDGSWTTAVCHEEDSFSFETGIGICIAKRALGKNFNKMIRKGKKVYERGVQRLIQEKAAKAEEEARAKRKLKKAEDRRERRRAKRIEELAEAMRRAQVKEEASEE